jgi:hypothetical protein
MNNLALRHVAPLTRDLCKIQGVDQIGEQEKEKGEGNRTQGDMAETSIGRIQEALGNEGKRFSSIEETSYFWKHNWTVRINLYTSKSRLC